MKDVQFAQRKDHKLHCTGVPVSPEWIAVDERFAESMNATANRLPWCTKVDTAWTVCLHKAGIIERETAAKLLRALDEILNNVKTGWGGEDIVVQTLHGDEDLGSTINYGRTLQEPMSRLQMRSKMVEVADDILALLGTVLEMSESNLDAVMPGHTHLSQAQPITLGHYMLSVFDCLHRGLRQFELAYVDTNRNSGGCGACSGTLWPVDRYLMAELLGFDDLVEPTYDSESAQDHSLSIMFALTNIGIHISRVAMDMNIWGMEEVDMLRTDPSWCGVSSMMPQKAIRGSQFERARIAACNVIGQMNTGVCLIKGEPHADMLQAVEVPKSALAALVHGQRAIGYLDGMLKNVHPVREKMLEYVREGFSCATEVVVHMVKELGCGNRRSHRIVATFVRMAREKGLKAFETTGELLDEAARFVDEKEPRIDTDTLRRLLDPEVFIAEHKHAGGTAPEEEKRLIAARKKSLKDARKRQTERKKRIAKGEEMLQREIDAILNG